MTRLMIATGQYEYLSNDDGVSWGRSLRVIPPKYSPVVRGSIDLSCLPPQGGNFRWDFVTLLVSGFGAATGHESFDLLKSVARLFITKDGGKQWREQDPRNSVSLFRKALQRLDLLGPTWPVERFESQALIAPDGAALSWSDGGWDDQQSHVISTTDRGESWRYCGLGDTNPYLAADYDGRLLASNDGFFLQSLDNGNTWSKRSFHMDWPVDCSKRVALLRHVTFAAPGIGYALVVHWPEPFTREMQPDVGLVKTADNGNRWSHLAKFAGPDVGDVNERHITSLKVF